MDYQYRISFRPHTPKIVSATKKKEVKSGSQTKKNTKTTSASSIKNEVNTRFMQGPGKYASMFLSTARKTITSVAHYFINKPLISKAGFDKAFNFLSNELIEEIFIGKERFNNSLLSSTSKSSIHSRSSHSTSHKDVILKDLLYEYMKTEASNLSLCMYIKKNLSGTLSTEEKIKKLRSAGLIKKNDRFTPSYFNTLMGKYTDFDKWGISQEKSNRSSAKVVLTEDEVLLLIAIYEVKAKGNYSTEAVTKRLLDTLDKGKKIKAEQKAHYQKAIELSKRLKPLIDLNLSKLFGTHPVHLANTIENILPGTKINISKGNLHHMMYIGNDAFIDVLLGQDVEHSHTATYISVKHVVDMFKFCRKNNSKLYMIPYKNPYPDDILLKRAIWCLGEYPNYDISTENCESFVEWVFQNKSDPSFCIVKEEQSKLPTTFISDILH
jgi:hypothetical protein